MINRTLFYFRYEWNTDYFGSGMDNIFILLVFKLLHLQQTNKEPNII